MFAPAFYVRASFLCSRQLFMFALIFSERPSFLATLPWKNRPNEPMAVLTGSKLDRLANLSVF